MCKQMVLLIILAFLFPGSLVEAQEGKGGILKVAIALDKLYKGKTSIGKAEMEIVTPHWKRVLKMDIWNEGMEKSFIRILTPRKERGVSTLKVMNEMWNYLPRTNKVIKIPPSMMMGSWMGSDFTNDDLVKEFTFVKDYSFERYEEGENISGRSYLKCIPKTGRPIVWGYIIVSYDNQKNIPYWYKYYDEKGRLMREMVYTDVKKMGGRLIPATITIIPSNKKGKRTIIRYKSLEFDKKLPKGIFSLRNLRKRI